MDRRIKEARVILINKRQSLSHQLRNFSKFNPQVTSASSEAIKIEQREVRTEESRPGTGDNVKPGIVYLKIQQNSESIVNGITYVVFLKTYAHVVVQAEDVAVENRPPEARVD